jgi:hypothetical protein
MDTPPDPFTVTPQTISEAKPDVIRERDPRFSVMVTAACTSAAVSLLTLWLWMPSAPPAQDGNGTVSVTYELLDPERAQDGRDDDADERAPVADVMSTRGDAGVVPRSGAARTSLESAAGQAERRGDDDLSPVGTARASRLSITTQPDGASVTINGVGYGTTPLSIPYLPPGAKRIRVTKAGYETEERFYSSDSGRASAIRITLRESHGKATR